MLIKYSGNVRLQINFNVCFESIFRIHCLVVKIKMQVLLSIKV